MNEAEFQHKVIQTAQQFGWKVAHFRPARTATGWVTPVAADGKGFPDLVLAHHRSPVIFAELKSDTGVLTVEQADWLHVLREADATTYTWRPRDWPWVLRLLSFGRATA